MCGYDFRKGHLFLGCVRSHNLLLKREEAVLLQMVSQLLSELPLFLMTAVATQHPRNRSRSDSLIANSTRSCASVGRSHCIAVTPCCASSPMSCAVAPMLATASYIGLRARSSRTITCSTRPTSKVACRGSASGSGDRGIKSALRIYAAAIVMVGLRSTSNSAALHGTSIGFSSPKTRRRSSIAGSFL
jgi:hypothetical protein